MHTSKQTLSIICNERGARFYQKESLFLEDTEDIIILVMAVKFGSTQLRSAALRNRNLPAGCAKILARSGKSWVKHRLARFSIDKEVLKILSQDKTYTVRRMANDQLYSIKEAKVC